MAIEETTSFDEQPPHVRVRRAAVMGGVGLVWAAFMVSIGFFLPALLVLFAATVGVAWTLGARVPRYDVRAWLGRALGRTLAAVTRARSSTGTAIRVAAAGAQRVSVEAGRTSGSGARSTAALARTAMRRTGHVTRRAAADTIDAGQRGVRRIEPAAKTAAAGAATTASAARRKLDRPRPETEASRLARDSTYLRRQGRIEEAVDAAEEAVVRFADDGDRRGRALASNSLGIALAKAGRHAEAIDAFDAALTLLTDCRDRHHEGQVLANLGAVHRRVGGAEAARFCWTRALERLEPGTRESERTAELLGVR